MPRLPQPGGDQDTWGNVLNDFLSQAHSADGALKTDSVGAAQLKSSAVASANIADGAITSQKLDAATQASLTKADTSVQTVNGKAPTSGDVSLTSNDLSDVITLTPSDGDVLTYDGFAEKWKSQPAPAALVTSVVGQTGEITGAQIAADAALTSTYAAKAGATYTGAHDFTSATVTGVPPVLTDKSTWTTGTVYAIGDVVTNANQRYVCKTANTAGATFAGDVAKWVSLDPGAAVPLAQSGQVPAQEPVGLGVTASVGTLAIAARADHVHKAPVGIYSSFGYGVTDVVFDGTTAITGFTLAGSVYSENTGSGVGPKHYKNMTVNVGVTVHQNTVWNVSGIATVNGTLSVAGGNASGATAGAAGPSGTAGGAGSTGVGAAGVSFTTGVNRNRTSQIGGAGGSANSGGTAGGAGGGAGPPWDTSYGFVSWPLALFTGNTTALGGSGLIGPGCGGGAGAGDGANAGGGGGGGGGLMILNTRVLAGSGILDASGGNGGNAAGGNAGGGGAGGAGVVIVNTSDVSGWSGTAYAARNPGGSAPGSAQGGSGSGTGAAGSPPSTIGGIDKVFITVWP